LSFPFTILKEKKICSLAFQSVEQSVWKDEPIEKAHSAKLEVLLAQTAFGLGLLAGLLRRSGLLY